MKVITNTEKIEKQKKLAKRLSPIAMVLLLAGLAVNIMSLRQSNSEGVVDPLYFYGTLVLLILGFILSNISSHLITHWVKEPRADQSLGKILKGFDNKHFLFNYTTKVPHILLTPTKIYAISTKDSKDTIEITGNKWKRNFSLSRFFRFFADEGLGNPTSEALQNAGKVSSLLKDYPEAADLPLEPVIVFTNPEVQLTIHSTEIPILKGKKLKSYIRDNEKGSNIDFETRQKLIEIFSNGFK